RPTSAVARPTSAVARPTSAAARPTSVAARPAAARRADPARPQAAKHDGAHARVAINHAGDLRPAREAVGRREEPLTAEEETAKQIEKLLRGPLRYGVTGLFVADARTGEALFAVNADDPLNPASNVKMISTATALELLGPDFRYPTRLLGATPDGGAVRGDVYLLGSYDPTLTTADLDNIASAVAARGITQIDGAIVVGPDPTRDGIFRSVIPIEIRAGNEPGAAVTATAPAGMDLISLRIAAKTSKPGSRTRLTFKVEPASDGAGHSRVVVNVGGTIARGRETMYPLVTRERTAVAAYALRTALRAHGVTVGGDFKVAELDNFVGESVAAGNLPIELGRHESPRLAQIIARVNKWSINWLADRVIMTAAALVKRQPPSMDLALSAMYDWLVRHPRIAKGDLLVDTGSGLSYHTRISAHELVSILRSAAGFEPDGDSALSQAWLSSLSVAGTDGTLSSRFRAGELRGHVRGKTGTLSNAIALSGILDFDPQRPLAFSLVTNGDAPLSKGYVRRAHEQVVGLLCRYLARTRKPDAAGPPPPPVPQELPAEPPPIPSTDLEDLEPDSALDDEAAGQR
ncbi:MAG TPA: D-alanyl-D-alanine carboxypeptidase, partial [Kofleriaceae bacterium]|nr:D-alanyl-D-alanine carboxypeptidase [Kofleriaceae bacterium]